MTFQVPDFLIHRRGRLKLLTCPLDAYVEGLEPERRPRLLPTSTACWRAYVATWRIAGTGSYSLA